MGRKKGSTLTKEERLERSKQRAIQHQLYRRRRLMLIAVAGFLYVVVPVLWYGAVEFGLVRQIRTPEFSNAISSARSLCFIILCFGLLDFYRDWREPKKENQVEEQSDEKTA